MGPAYLQVKQARELVQLGKRDELPFAEESAALTLSNLGSQPGNTCESRDVSLRTTSHPGAARTDILHQLPLRAERNSDRAAQQLAIVEVVLDDLFGDLDRGELDVGLVERVQVGSVQEDVDVRRGARWERVGRQPQFDDGAGERPGNLEAGRS